MASAASASGSSTNNGNMEDDEEKHAGEEIETYFFSVLDKVEGLVQDWNNRPINEFENDYIASYQANVNVVLVQIDKVIGFIRHLLLSVERNLQQEFEHIYESFLSILRSTGCLFMDLSSVNGASRIGTRTFEKHEAPRRPKRQIQSEMLEELRGIGFPWIKIADMFGVSRWTISRCVREYGLQDMQGLSDLSATDLDSLVSDFLERHGHSAGQVYVSGYLQSIGLRIQRQRVRESLVRVDPDNRILC